MADENCSSTNYQGNVKIPKPAATECHKRWMEISRDSIAPKVSEFPSRVAELTKLFEPPKRNAVTVPAAESEISSSEFIGLDVGVNTEISGNLRLHVAEVQSYLNEIASLRRSVAMQQREISDLKISKEEQISDLRQELRILGELHSDEKENFQVEMAMSFRKYKADVRKLEEGISRCTTEKDQLQEELSRRLRQLSIASEKYRKLKIGNANLQSCDLQWQQKFYNMQSELELQRENFQQQITDLYWETVAEYEAAFTAELTRQQETFKSEKSSLKKAHHGILWNILFWTQGLTVFVAFVFYFLAIR